MTARELTAAHGSSFYLASRLIDRRQQAACYTLYAFLRRFDDAVDTPSDVPPLAAVEQARAFIHALESGAPTDGVVSPSLLPQDECAAFTAATSWPELASNCRRASSDEG